MQMMVRDIARQSNVNKMTVSNLSMIFAPNFLRPPLLESQVMIAHGAEAAGTNRFIVHPADFWFVGCDVSHG